MAMLALLLRLRRWPTKRSSPAAILALVLPLINAASGQSWQKVPRDDCSRLYGTDRSHPCPPRSNEGLSFSADTGMAECLVIARKNAPGDSARAAACSLHHSDDRPQGFAHARSMAMGSYRQQAELEALKMARMAELLLMIGAELIGEAIDAPHTENDWNAVRISDCSVVQTAYALSKSRLWLPGLVSSAEFRTLAALGEVGRRGWHDINIAGSTGPFAKATPSTNCYLSLRCGAITLSRKRGWCASLTFSY